MNAGRDVERLIANWLIEEAVQGAPDRVLDVARDAISHTRQRRLVVAWGDEMNLTLARAAGIAAVVTVFVAGALWLGGRTSSIGPSAPTPSPTAIPTVGPTSAGVALPIPGPFDPGTYILGDPFELTITIHFPTPGWEVWGGQIASQVAPFDKTSPDPPGLALVFVDVDNVYADACHPTRGLLDPPLGPTVDDLVTALAGQTATDATAPTDVTISGYKGKHFEYTNTGKGPGCETITRWPSQRGDRFALPGEHDELWILDVDGTRLVIDLASFVTTSDADIAEARAIVAGLQIQP